MKMEIAFSRSTLFYFIFFFIPRDQEKLKTQFFFCRVKIVEVNSFRARNGVETRKQVVGVFCMKIECEWLDLSFFFFLFTIDAN